MLEKTGLNLPDLPVELISGEIGGFGVSSPSLYVPVVGSMHIPPLPATP